MKKRWLVCVTCLFLFNACRLLHFGRKEEKSGCPTTGNNIGAERILSGDPKAIKAAKKAGNKKSDKGLGG